MTKSTDDEIRARSPWLTVREAAARAKVSDKALTYAIRTNKLKAARLGARQQIRIHEDWLDAWIAAAVIVNPDAPGADPATLSFPGATGRRR